MRGSLLRGSLIIIMGIRGRETFFFPSKVLPITTFLEWHVGCGISGVFKICVFRVKNWKMDADKGQMSILIIEGSLSALG